MVGGGDLDEGWVEASGEEARDSMAGEGDERRGKGKGGRAEQGTVW